MCLVCSFNIFTGFCLKCLGKFSYETVWKIIFCGNMGGTIQHPIKVVLVFDSFSSWIYYFCVWLELVYCHDVSHKDFYDYAQWDFENVRISERKRDEYVNEYESFNFIWKIWICWFEEIFRTLKLMQTLLWNHC